MKAGEAARDAVAPFFSPVVHYKKSEAGISFGTDYQAVMQTNRSSAFIGPPQNVQVNLSPHDQLITARFCRAKQCRRRAKPQCRQRAAWCWEAPLKADTNLYENVNCLTKRLLRNPFIAKMQHFTRKLASSDLHVKRAQVYFTNVTVFLRKGKSKKRSEEKKMKCTQLKHKRIHTPVKTLHISRVAIQSERKVCPPHFIIICLDNPTFNVKY